MASACWKVLRGARFDVTRMRLYVGLAAWQETVCLSIELQLNY